jgi:hypothetical protein
VQEIIRQVEELNIVICIYPAQVTPFNRELTIIKARSEKYPGGPPLFSQKARAAPARG